MIGRIRRMIALNYQTTTAQARHKWESLFERWAQPPAQTEQDRCDNAVKQIRDAISAYSGLSDRHVKTFAQGSLKNRVNVRKDSDADVCCLHSGVYQYSLPPGYDAAYFDIIPATYNFSTFRNDVETALVDRFGERNVTRGNKAFDIHENTRRVDADAVAAFAFRQYFFKDDGSYSFHPGTALITDREGMLITNFPDQQYKNGVDKNEATGRRFKKQVRIEKALCNMMGGATPITSFLIESWVWCAPDECFGGDTLFDDFESVLFWVDGQVDDAVRASILTEVNGVKRLFGHHNPWTPQDVRAFFKAAWHLTHST